MTNNTAVLTMDPYTTCNRSSFCLYTAGLITGFVLLSTTGVFLAGTLPPGGTDATPEDVRGALGAIWLVLGGMPGLATVSEGMAPECVVG